MLNARLVIDQFISDTTPSLNSIDPSSFGTKNSGVPYFILSNHILSLLEAGQVVGWQFCYDPALKRESVAELEGMKNRSEKLMHLLQFRIARSLSCQN